MLFMAGLGMTIAVIGCIAISAGWVSKEKNKKMIGSGALMVLGGALSASFAGEMPDVVVIGLVMSVAGAILLIVPIVTSSIAKRKKAEEENLRKKEEQRKQAEALQKRREDFAAGTWEFPSKVFYEELTKSDIKSLSSEFAMLKAKAVAERIITKRGISKDEKGFDQYVTEDKLKEYYAEGCNAHKTAVMEAEAAEAKRLITPQKVKLEESEQKTRKFAKKVSELYGLDKRRAFIDRDIAAAEDRIAELRGIADGHLYRNIVNSTPQERTHNWGIAGGIASGIAGPGAGIMAASEVMEENQRIEQRNAEAIKANAYLAMASLEAQAEAEEKIKWQRKCILRLKSERDELNEKVVLQSVGLKDLSHKLMFENKSFKECKRDTGPYTNMTIRVHNYYSPKENADNLVVDGIMTAKVFCRGVCLETVDIPFPFYGIKCGGSGDCYIPLAMCLPDAKPGDYTAECTFKSLWLMEK